MEVICLEILSKRIKDLRTDADLKQADLALILGITQNMVSNYENGRDIPPEVLVGYAKHFNVSSDFLLGISTSQTPANTNVLKPFDLLCSVDPSSFSINDILTLARKFTDYYAAGAPAGAAPMQAFKGYLSAMGGVLSAATAMDIAALLIQVNALGACCLQANEILTSFMVNQKGK